MNTSNLNQKMPWLLQDDAVVISDTHFNHINIQRYCNRPENWQTLVIQNWNKMVAPQQPVLHLGDFALGPRDKEAAVLQQLNGEIFLLQGNHDSHLIDGIKMIYSDFLLDFDEYQILFSHRPRLLEPNLDQKPLFNVHGHIHNNPTPEAEDLYHLNLSIEVTNYAPVTMGEIKKELFRRMTLLPLKKL